MADRYIVKTPLVVVRVLDTERYLSGGTLVPEAVSDKEIKRLLSLNLLEKVEVIVSAVIEVPPPGDDSTTGQGKTGGDGKPSKPAANAGLPKWVEYAESIGIELADGVEKDTVRQLVEAKLAETQDP